MAIATPLAIGSPEVEMSRRKVLVMGGVVVAGVLLPILWFVSPLPRITITEQYQPVRVAPPAIAMLDSAPLIDIQMEVEATGLHVDQIRTLWGETILDAAAARGRADVVEWLVDQGADPDGKEGHRGGPLCSVVVFKDLRTLEVLLAAGADPDINESGAWSDRRTARSLASQIEENEEVVALIERYVPWATVQHRVGTSEGSTSVESTSTIIIDDEG
jgi:hypothetical protein